ncbi:MAG: ribbon-helix-helix domain-containing protein [Spirochaetales bacterium]|nr:ribbon-helix-helix domain-containing protein [Spirochaetales bacterium]
MPTSTVNISFQSDLLRQIDSIAKEESRSRSELIRESARMYIDRKNRWKSIFTLGETLQVQNEITEQNIFDEINAVRNKNI